MLFNDCCVGELQRCLSREILAKCEDRCREEALNLADIDDLVRCVFPDVLPIHMVFSIAAHAPPDNIE